MNLQSGLIVVICIFSLAYVNPPTTASVGDSTTFQKTGKITEININAREFYHEDSSPSARLSDQRAETSLLLHLLRYHVHRAS